MHTRKLTKWMVATAALGVVALAGPPLACRDWVVTPGSLFETLNPMRLTAMAADDSPAQKQAAVKRITDLKAAIVPGDPVSIMKAGYWTEVMHDIKITDQSGEQLIEQAIAMRPADADYQVIGALTYLGRDKSKFRAHWTQAKKLAKPGSAAAQNLGVITREYGESYRDYLADND
jgi:hypothetical protein